MLYDILLALFATTMYTISDILPSTSSLINSDL